MVNPLACCVATGPVSCCPVLTQLESSRTSLSRSTKLERSTGALPMSNSGSMWSLLWRRRFLAWLVDVVVVNVVVCVIVVFEGRSRNQRIYIADV